MQQGITYKNYVCACAAESQKCEPAIQQAVLLYLVPGINGRFSETGTTLVFLNRRRKYTGTAAAQVTHLHLHP